MVRNLWGAFFWCLTDITGASCVAPFAGALSIALLLNLFKLGLSAGVDKRDKQFRKFMISRAFLLRIVFHIVQFSTTRPRRTCWVAFRRVQLFLQPGRGELAGHEVVQTCCRFLSGSRGISRYAGEPTWHFSDAVRSNVCRQSPCRGLAASQAHVPQQAVQLGLLATGLA